MKSKFVCTAMIVLLSHIGYAQTKGTHTLGFGVNMNTSTTTNESGGEAKNKNNFFTLGYGHFIADNQRIGVELTYSTYSQKNNMQTGYASNTGKGKGRGVNVNYQHYYPLVKTLFAYAGGRAGYFSSKQSQTPSYNNPINFETYSLGAYGGVTWFLSKTFALETSLLSASASYDQTKLKSFDGNNFSTQKSTSFNVSTAGLINDLGFKIYVLF